MKDDVLEARFQALHDRISDNRTAFEGRMDDLEGGLHNHELTCAKDKAETKGTLNLMGIKLNAIIWIGGVVGSSVLTLVANQTFKWFGG